MIYVSKRQLNQVEYLLQQSIQGHHVLFDHETIRQILVSDEPGEGAPAPSIAVGPLIESLILEPTIESKKEFLRKLDRRTFERVVRTYFNIVENKINENRKVLHS